MEKFELKILKVETKIEENRFERAHDIGNSGIFTTPKQFVVSFECETVGQGCDFKPEKVYFTHRFDFRESISKFGGQYSCRKESEFVLFIEGKLKKHVGGLRNNETYFTCYGNFISKFQEGETIFVKASAENKTSKVGNNYIQLKRVKLNRDIIFHSFSA
jgi:hypothetical protein